MAFIMWSINASLQEPAIYSIIDFFFHFFCFIFLLHTIPRKHYKVVVLDYTILITIIFIAFLN